jgi:hypothetical protein
MGLFFAGTAGRRQLRDPATIWQKHTGRLLPSTLKKIIIEHGIG